MQPCYFYPDRVVLMAAIVGGAEDGESFRRCGGLGFEIFVGEDAIEGKSQRYNSTGCLLRTTVYKNRRLNANVQLLPLPPTTDDDDALLWPQYRCRLHRNWYCQSFISNCCFLWHPLLPFASSSPTIQIRNNATSPQNVHHDRWKAEGRAATVEGSRCKFHAYSCS